MSWKRVEKELPPEGVLVEVTTPNGNVCKLKRKNNLWFSGDMYVYYSPVMWRHLKYIHEWNH